jgi:hypothetical protein
MDTRAPPKEIRDHLRREVNFGCPVCRSPFLTYHHFDPTWEPRHIHYEPGMIALCSECHKFADGGHYSTEQLRQLKSNPPITPPKGCLPWNAQNVVVMFGGNFFVAHKDYLFAFRVDGREVFSFCLMENGYLAINAQIYTRTNDLVCKIDQNDILLNMETTGDLMCTVQGKEIAISSLRNDARLHLRFERSDKDKFISSIRQKWPGCFSNQVKAEAVRNYIEKSLDSDGLCPTLTILADIYSPNVPISTVGQGIILDFYKPIREKMTWTGQIVGEGAIRFNRADTQTELIHLGFQ